MKTQRREGGASRTRVVAPALGIFGVLAGLLWLELGLRLVWPQENIYLYEYRDGHVFNLPEYDDLFAMSPTASLEALRKALPEALVGPAQPGPMFKERMITNADGMRDDRRPDPKARRLPRRILNLGDSIGFGWPVALEDIYVKRLEEALPDVETINCSLIGTSTVELEKLYERRCQAYDADVVIVQVVIHIGTIAPDYIATDPFGPDFRLIKAIWRTRHRDTYRDVAYDHEGLPYLPDEVLARPDVDELLRRYYDPRLPLYRASHLVRFVENRWFTESLNLSGGDLLEDRLREGAGERLAGERPTYHATLRALLRLRAKIEARGARMLVLFFPTSYQARARVLEPRPDFDELKVTLRGHDVDFVDAGALVTSQNLDDVYYAYDHHPKAAGHALIAQALAAHLRQRYFPALDPARAP